MKKKNTISEIDEIVVYEQSPLMKILTNAKYRATNFNPTNPKKMHKLNQKIKNRHHAIYVKSVENSASH